MTELAEYGPECDNPNFINVLRADYAATATLDDDKNIIEEHFKKATFIVIWGIWMGLVVIMCMQCRRMIASQRQKSFNTNLEMVNAGDKAKAPTAAYNSGLPQSTDRAMTEPENVVGIQNKVWKTSDRIYMYFQFD